MTLAEKLQIKKITSARRVMREVFAADPDFRRAYQDNIAMLLHDRLNVDHATRNAVADELLKLIFN